MRQKKIVFIGLMVFALCACATTDVRNTSYMPDQTAYDFNLFDQDGKSWKLSEVLKDYRGVILAFYPKDDTGV